MKLITKTLLAAAALATVTAAGYPRGIIAMYGNGTYPQDLRKREALKTCRQDSPSFVGFLASDRDQCYREMRGVGMAAGFSGVWSKPDRKHMPIATLD